MAAGSRADLLKKTIREGHSVRARARARSGRFGVRHVVEHRTLNHRGTCREHLRTVRCYPPPLFPIPLPRPALTPAACIPGKHGAGKHWLSELHEVAFGKGGGERVEFTTGVGCGRSRGQRDTGETRPRE